MFFFNNKDEYFMFLALKEAKKGLGYTSPNPMVGALLVKNGKILGKAFHKALGEFHAERVLIENLPQNIIKDSTMYVTLEPCNHEGRTPPCVPLIIKSGIKKVVIATLDPDKRVNGSGVNILKNSGIQIKLGIMEREANELNNIYMFYKKNRRPYIVLKAALTLDGKIATSSFDSKWISNDISREIVHRLRLRLKAIAIGKNTIKRDSPKLNCRLEGFENKIVDKLVFSEREDNKLTKSFAENDGKILFVPKKVSRDENVFFNFCVNNEIDSVLVEGGGKLYSYFLKKSIVDKIFLFYKPSFLGVNGVSIFQKKGQKFIKDLNEFKIDNVTELDNNIMVELSRGESLCLLD